MIEQKLYWDVNLEVRRVEVVKRPLICCTLLIIENKLVTPPVTEGCIKGVVRQKIIDLVKKSSLFEIEERVISPFELKKVDELFISNSIIDIQPVTKYRKKIFKTELSLKLDSLLKESYFN